jgi:hypothetical protein
MNRSPISAYIDHIIDWRERAVPLTYAEIADRLDIDVHPEAIRGVYRRYTNKQYKEFAPEKNIFSPGVEINKGLQKVAFPTDEHFPFQDDRARSVALQIVEDFKPTVIISGSDGMDFYGISKYDKNPVRVRETNLQEEIDMWGAGQREWISAAPNARNIFINGNHEDRFRRYMWKHPELSGLRALQFHNILELDKLGIEYASSEVVFHNKLVIKHGSRVSKHAAYTAKLELDDEKHSVSIMTGHVHRGGSHYVTTRSGVMQAHECFCLCDTDPEYVRNPNWQQGIALATVSDDVLTVELIPFYNKRGQKTAFWRDKRYIE